MQPACYAKVSQAYLASAVDQDVASFDVLRDLSGWARLCRVCEPRQPAMLAVQLQHTYAMNLVVVMQVH